MWSHISPALHMHSRTAASALSRASVRRASVMTRPDTRVSMRAAPPAATLPLLAPSCSGGGGGEGNGRATLMAAGLVAAAAAVGAGVASEARADDSASGVPALGRERHPAAASPSWPWSRTSRVAAPSPVPATADHVTVGYETYDHDYSLSTPTPCRSGAEAWLPSKQWVDAYTASVKAQKWCVKAQAGAPPSWKGVERHIAPPIVHFTPNFCGGEVRVEADMVLRSLDPGAPGAKPDAAEARLFEGASYNTTDLDDERMGVLRSKQPSNAIALGLTNGELFGGDESTVIFTRKKASGSGHKASAPLTSSGAPSKGFAYVRKLTPAEAALVNTNSRFGSGHHYKYVTVHELRHTYTATRADGTPRTITVVVPVGFLCDGSSGDWDKMDETEWLVHDWLYATRVDADGAAVSKAEADDVFTSYRHFVLAMGELVGVNVYARYKGAFKKELAGGKRVCKPHFLCPTVPAADSE